MTKALTFQGSPCCFQCCRRLLILATQWAASLIENWLAFGLARGLARGLRCRLARELTARLLLIFATWWAALSMRSWLAIPFKLLSSRPFNVLLARSRYLVLLTSDFNPEERRHAFATEYSKTAHSEHRQYHPPACPKRVLTPLNKRAVVWPRPNLGN